MNCRLLKVSVVHLLFCFTIPIFAQNLIPNPSLELSNDVTNDSLYMSEYVFPATIDWFSPTIDYGPASTSDTIEILRGNLNLYKPKDQLAYLWIASGSSYLTPFGYGKTYAQTRLKDSLTVDCYYQLSFFALPIAVDFFGDSVITASWCSSNRLGAYFSKTRIHDPDTNRQFGYRPGINTFVGQGIVPQVAIPIDSFIMDTAEYSLIEEVFKAEGGERYMTIGNFYSMADTRCKNFRTGLIYSDTTSNFNDMWRSSWNVDDLKLVKVLPPDSLLSSSNDTVICPGDTIWLSAFSRDTTNGIKWDNGSIDSLRPVTEPGVYWVELDCGCDLTLVDTIIVGQFKSLPNLKIPDTTVCPGESVSYSLPVDLDYNLNGVVSGSSFTISDTGTHILEVSNGCFDSTYVFNVSFLKTESLPNLEFNDTILCDGEEAVYQIPPGFSYELNGSVIAGPFVVSSIGDYVLKIFNSCDTTKYSFKVDDEGCEMLLFVPNAFTPDGDGLNDCFKVFVIQFLNYSISIFNRWGQLVYQSNDPNQCWDGSYNGEVKQDVYSYKISVQTGDRVQNERGVVTVLK